MATKPPRKKGKPKSWRERFLASLKETGLVTLSCARANVNKTTAYEHRKKDPEFARAWDDALEAATDDLVLEARRRADKGTLEPVYYQGKRCGAIRRYSDVLLMFLIKKERPAYRDGRPDEQSAGASRPRLKPALRDDRFEPSDPG